MNQDILNIAFEESVDNEALEHIKSSLSPLGENVDFHEIPDRGPQASTLLLGFTSIAIIFSVAFVKKLGDRAAEDCYPHIKNALSKVYKKYFGGDAEYKVSIISSSEQKAPDTKYSLILALYCVGKDNERVKFLYETNWSEVEFERATAVYLDAMANFVSDGSGAVNNLIASSQSRMQPYLISWDVEKGTLIKVNAFPDHVHI